MKVAIAMSGETLDAPCASRFGRAMNFVIVDTDTGEWAAYPNPGARASSGAGTQAAQFVADLGARAVISNNFGPHATESLTSAGIRMFLAGCTGHDVLERYRHDHLKQTLAFPTGTSLLEEIPCSSAWEGF